MIRHRQHTRVVCRLARDPRGGSAPSLRREEDVCVWGPGYYWQMAGVGERAAPTRMRACPHAALLPSYLQPPLQLFAALPPRHLQFNTPALCSRSPLIRRPYPQECAVTAPAVRSYHPRLLIIPLRMFAATAPVICNLHLLWASGKACSRLVLTTTAVSIS